jgi:hypothetical protein
MSVVLGFVGAVGLLLGWAVLSTWLASRRGAGEERAHASAWRRRKRFLGHDGETKTESASMMILGDFESPSECRVKRISGSRLQAFASRAVGEGSQVRVDWGDDVFIGHVSAEQPGLTGYALDIDLVSSTYSAGLLTKLIGRFQS